MASMNERKEFLLLRAGTVMGAGLGLGIGIGLMMVGDGIVLPRWLAEIHSNFAVVGALPMISFIGGLLLVKRARVVE
jgi:hypothetical protein